MVWGAITGLCSDADLIVDDKLTEALIWRGGLSNLVSCGALSCQSLHQRVKSSGTSAVILISGALIGKYVLLIQKIMETCTWNKITILTATSGLSHLMLHDVEHQFSDEEVFNQFKSKVLEWNPNDAEINVQSSTQMEVIDFKWGGDFQFAMINKPTPFLKPLNLQNLKGDGSGPYCYLDLPDQIQISDFAETVRLRLQNRHLQADIWSCGELSTMVGNRIQSRQTKSDQKVGMVIFDRTVQFHAEKSGNGFDDLFFYAEPEGRVNLKSKMLGMSTNVTMPSSERESKLFAALFDNTLEYAYTLALRLCEEIFDEEDIKIQSNDGFLSSYLDLVSKFPEAVMYNAGFLSLCNILDDAHGKQVLMNKATTLSDLKSYMSEYQPNQIIYLLIQIISSTDVEIDDFQMFISSFCLFLSENKYPLVDLEPEATLEDIVEVITPKMEYVYSNINESKKTFGGLGFNIIIENLFGGLPLPNFMKHHAEGLIGKLTSGFGLFGGGNKEKNLSDYDHIVLLFVGGLSFAELKSIKRIEEVSGKKFEIISNSFYTKSEAIQWL